MPPIPRSPAPRARRKPRRLAGRKVAILVEKMYEDLELHYPRLRLIEEGAEVHVVGPRAGETYLSKHGYPATATHAASKVRGNTYDCVVIPGGYAPDHMRRTPAMVDLVRDAHFGGAVLAAICHGPWMFCSVPETIRGRRLACFFAIRDDVVNAGGIYMPDETCVVDGRIVTARVPDDLPAFTTAIVETMVTVRTATRATARRSARRTASARTRGRRGNGRRR